MRLRWLHIQQLLINELDDSYDVQLGKCGITLCMNGKFIAGLSLDERPETPMPAFYARFMVGDSERISLGYTDAAVARTFKQKVEWSLNQLHLKRGLEIARANNDVDMLVQCMEKLLLTFEPK